MKNSYLTLFLEINESNFVFFVGKKDEQNNFCSTFKLSIPIEGYKNCRISDFEKFLDIIKKNIYLIEQKLDYTFKEIILILGDYNSSFINLSGYKKLNGSQILRENITYILNTLKAYVDKFESKKKIIHIFNTKFLLDNRKIENLPIGLFGDFYSHELSFTLIDKNDFKNINNIFQKCNLKIKKILLKSFVKGAHICNNNQDLDTFFLVKIGKAKSQIFFFENNTLKFEQTFYFGSDLIIQDISKITSLKKSTIKKILEKIDFNHDFIRDELIEEDYFKEDAYRKIKKKLIYDIIIARIEEISEIIVFKNINLKSNEKSSKILFLEIDEESNNQNLSKIYENIFSLNGSLGIRTLNNFNSESLITTAYRLVHFGWKKEAIPTTRTKKSLITRFFDTIFD